MSPAVISPMRLRISLAFRFFQIGLSALFLFTIIYSAANANGWTNMTSRIVQGVIAVVTTNLISGLAIRWTNQMARGGAFCGMLERVLRVVPDIFLCIVWGSTAGLMLAQLSPSRQPTAATAGDAMPPYTVWYIGIGAAAAELVMFALTAGLSTQIMIDMSKAKRQQDAEALKMQGFYDHRATA